MPNRKNWITIKRGESYKEENKPTEFKATLVVFDKLDKPSNEYLVP